MYYLIVQVPNNYFIKEFENEQGVISFVKRNSLEEREITIIEGDEYKIKTKLVLKGEN